MKGYYMENKFIKGFRKYGSEIKEHKGTFAVYIVLRALVIAVGVISFIGGNYQNCFLCLLSLILFLLPAFVQKNFGIELPQTLEIIVLLFIFAAEILGEISGFYVKVVFWDSPYGNGLSRRRHRICPSRYPQPKRALQAADIPRLYGHRCILLFNDRGSRLGAV